MSVRHEPLTSGGTSEAPHALLGRLESEAQRLVSPCGPGAMVWRVWGSGPPLVLLHGGYGSWRHWVRNIPFFAATRTVLAADLPGLGDSDDVPAPVTPEHIAEIISEGIAKILPGDARFDLMGFSFGAMICGLVAERIGGRIRTLSLVGGDALGLPRNQVELVKWSQDRSVAACRSVHRINLERLMFADPDNIDELAVLIQDANVRRARVRSRPMARTDVLAQALRRVKVKRIHAFWGACDSVVGRHMGAREALLREIRPDIIFRVIDRAGHWLPYEAADAFNVAATELMGTPPTRHAPRQVMR